MAKVWISREWRDAGKRKRKKISTVGVTGVKANDRFVIQWLDPDGKLRQERIAAPGKPGKRIADERSAQIAGSLALGTYQGKNTATWEAFRNDFEKVVAEKAVETQRLYNEALDLFEEICSPKLMRSIGPQSVDEFRATLRTRAGKKKGTTMSPACVNKHLRHLRAALRKAHKWEYLSKQIDVEMMREAQKEAVFMEPADFDAIYLACDNATVPDDRPYSASAWWRGLMVAGIMTGMRRDEMLTLMWSDVRLDDGYLILRAADTKAKREDIIPIHPVVADHLKWLKTNFGELVFDWPFGTTRLYSEWHRIQRLAGINLGCREDHEHTARCRVYGFHSLKKACGTLNADRIPESVLGAFMRHSSAATTRKYYQNRRRILVGHADAMFVPEAATKKAS